MNWIYSMLASAVGGIVTAVVVTIGTWLISNSITIVLIVLGLFIVAGLLWWMVSFRVAIIGLVVGGIILAGGVALFWFAESKGEQVAQAMLQPTIEALQTSVAILTPTTAPKNIVSIKSMPSLYVRSYGEASENRDELHSNLSIIQSEDGSASYAFNYNLPETGSAYAGFQFVFDDPQNLKDYKFIEVDIDFDDTQTICSLKILDNNKGDHYSPILGPNKTFRISMKDAMGDLNVEAIKSIEFIAQSNFGQGEHNFTVHDVRFIK